MKTISQVANIRTCEPFWFATHLGSVNELISQYYKPPPRLFSQLCINAEFCNKIPSIYLYSGYFKFYLLTLFLWEVNIHTCHPNCNGSLAKPPLTTSYLCVSYHIDVGDWLMEVFYLYAVPCSESFQVFLLLSLQIYLFYTSESIHRSVMENDKVWCHIKRGLLVIQDNTLSIFCVNSTRDIQIDRWSMGTPATFDVFTNSMRSFEYRFFIPTKWKI